MASNLSGNGWLQAMLGGKAKTEAANHKLNDLTCQFQNMQIADGASFCLENHEDQLSSFKGSPDDENDCEVSSECDDASCEGGGASEGSSKLAGSVTEEMSNAGTVQRLLAELDLLKKEFRMVMIVNAELHSKLRDSRISASQSSDEFEKRLAEKERELAGAVRELEAMRTKISKLSKTGKGGRKCKKCSFCNKTCENQCNAPNCSTWICADHRSGDVKDKDFRCPLHSKF